MDRGHLAQILLGAVSSFHMSGAVPARHWCRKRYEAEEQDLGDCCAFGRPASGELFYFKGHLRRREKPRRETEPPTEKKIEEQTHAYRGKAKKKGERGKIKKKMKEGREKNARKKMKRTSPIPALLPCALPHIP